MLAGSRSLVYSLGASTASVSWERRGRSVTCLSYDSSSSAHLQESSLSRPPPRRKPRRRKPSLHRTLQGGRQGSTARPGPARPGPAARQQAGCLFGLELVLSYTTNSDPTPQLGARLHADGPVELRIYTTSASSRHLKTTGLPPPSGRGPAPLQSISVISPSAISVFQFFFKVNLIISRLKSSTPSCVPVTSCSRW